MKEEQHEAPRPPKCPYCKKDMPIVVLYPYQIGHILLPTMQCPWCAVMLHMHVILTEQEKPEEQTGGMPPPKIWKPS
jgi:hypothetical protein